MLPSQQWAYTLAYLALRVSQQKIQMVLAMCDTSLLLSAGVMEELDMDGEGNLDLHELSQSLDQFRRQRRAFASETLQEVLNYIEHTRQSVSRIFAAVDEDGSGDLDATEFRTAMKRMKISLSTDEADVDAPRNASGEIFRLSGVE